MRGRQRGRRADEDNRFFDNPILDSPYERPAWHWELGPDGQPTQNVVERRRWAEFISPIPKPKKRGGGREMRRGRNPRNPGLRRRQGALHPRAAVRKARRDHQRRPPRGRCVAAATGPAPVAGDPGDRTPAPAPAGSPIHRRPALPLPGRSDRDGDLADRGQPRGRAAGPADASMRPRRFRRGMRRHMSGEKPYRVASMRPRRFRRGITPAPGPVPPRPSASMRPRRFRRGMANTSGSTTVAIALQ